MLRDMHFVPSGHWVCGDGRTTSYTFDHDYVARLRVKIFDEDAKRLGVSVTYPSPMTVTVSFDVPPADGQRIYIGIGGAKPNHPVSEASDSAPPISN